jgi:aminoglycoside phosphotransferase (APT) family kinase protein
MVSVGVDTGGVGRVEIGAGVSGLPEGFEVGEVLAETAKSVVRSGWFEGRRVVCKQLTSIESFWVARFANEIDAYRRLGETGSVVAPVLRWYSPTALIVDLAEGTPLGRGRHPGRVDRAMLAAVLGALDVVPSLRGGRGDDTDDDRERLERYAGSGQIDGGTARLLARLLDVEVGLVFQHGDVIPPNVIVGAGGVVLLDWEFAGWYRPGRDLAVLATCLHRDEVALAAIRGVVEGWGRSARAGFAAGHGLSLARELRLQREAGHGELVVSVGRCWDRFRADLAGVVRGVGA